MKWQKQLVCLLVTQRFSAMLEHPTLCMGLLYLTDHFSEAEKFKVCPYLSQNGSTVTFSGILLDRLESLLAVSTWCMRSFLSNRTVLRKRKDISCGLPAVPVFLAGVDQCCTSTDFQVSKIFKIPLKCLWSVWRLSIAMEYISAGSVANLWAISLDHYFLCLL